jgi:hypothetical protein
MMTSVMTTVNIDLWILLVGVGLPSACLLMICFVYCWRRLSLRQRGTQTRPANLDTGFDQQVLLEMVLQQVDTAFNNIVDTVQAQRIQMLKVLETHGLAPPNQMPAPSADGPNVSPTQVATAVTSVSAKKATDEESIEQEEMAPGHFSKTGAPEKAALFDPYSQIPDYIHRGLSIPEVAARLDLPESAVELYVSLRMSANKDGRQITACVRP